MAGAGSTPGGAASGGAGIPAQAPAPLTAIYPDVLTGQSRSGRLLDPSTGQYVYTADGRVAGMGTVPQLVAIAFGTIKGRSAIPSLGQTYSTLREKTPDWQRQIATIAQSTLARLIQQKLVQLVGVNATEPTADGTFAEIVWRDLTAPVPTSGGGSTFQEYRTPI